MDYSKSKKVSYLPTARLAADKFREPIRVELLKKQVNPQLLQMRQSLERSSNSFTNDFIKSPLQKDQFMYRSHVNRTEPVISTSNSRKMASTRDPQALVTRSFPHLQLKQTFNYLQQIISDLSQRDQFVSTRKYAKLIEGKIGQQCEKIMYRIEKGELNWKKLAENCCESARRILSYYFRVDTSKGMHPQKIMIQLQKAVKGILDNNQTRRMSSKQKIKESKSLNSKLQKQSQQLHRFFQQQKGKLKQNYQDIYRKIYEQKSKYKKDLEKSNKMVEEEQRQQRIIKEKYEQIFKEISEELNSLKMQYREVKEQNAKDKNKITILKNLLFSKEEENSKLNQQVGDLMNEVNHCNFQILSSREAARGLEEVVRNFQKQINDLKLDIFQAKLAEEFRLYILHARQDKETQTQDQQQQKQQKDENALLESSNHQLLQRISQIEIKIRQELKIQQQQKIVVSQQQANNLQKEKQATNNVSQVIEQESSQIIFNSKSSEVKQEEILNKIKLKQVQLEQLIYQYEHICQKFKGKKAQFDVKMQELEHLDGILEDKKNIIKLLDDQQKKKELSLIQKDSQLQDLSKKALELSKFKIQKEIEIEHIENELTIRKSYSLQAAKHAEEVHKSLQMKQKLDQDLRMVEYGLQQSSKELKKAEQTKNLLQKDIVQLMQVLIRLQSDKMIKVELLEEGSLKWVQRFWKWMKQAGQLEQFL